MNRTVNAIMKTNHDYRLVGLVDLIAVALLWGTAVQAEEAAQSIESATQERLFQSLDVSGSFNTSYSFRNFDGRDDSDFYNYFALRAKDVVKDTVDGSISWYWHEDLNGDSSLRGNEAYDPFLDLDDASDTDFRFYTGYIDLKNESFSGSRLRLGRQFLEEIDLAHFDGATYWFTPTDPLEITLFGGRPVTFYSSTRGDSFYGLNAQYRFSETTKAAARYYRYDADEFQDDIGAVEVWHIFSPSIQGHTQFSLLDGEPYLWKNDAYFRVDKIDLDVLAQVVRLFEDVSDHTINFNPYFPLLNGYEPFTHGSLSLTKGLGKYVSLTAGFDVKEVDGNPNPVVASTNPDYARGTLGAEFYPIEGLTLSIDGEYWSVDSDNEFTGVTGEIEYRPSRKWTLNAGVDYGEYVQEYADEFLFFFGQKETFRITPDVLTYYARVMWRPTSSIYASARFEIEDSDFDDEEWYALRLQAGVNF